MAIPIKKRTDQELQLKKLLDKLSEVVVDEFYGNISIDVQAGKIVSVVKRESIKL